MPPGGIFPSHAEAHMRTISRKRSVSKAVFETLEARQLLSSTGSLNAVWSGGDTSANVAPGLTVPSNAAQWDDATTGAMTGSSTITLTLSGIASHTLIDGYGVSVVGPEGLFTLSVNGVQVGQASLDGMGKISISGGANQGYDESSNLDDSGSSVTLTLTAQLENESDSWQVASSVIDVSSYVGVQDLQDGSLQPGNASGIFRFTRSDNSGPASSSLPLDVYYNLDQPIGDVQDSDGNWISSIDGTYGQFHGPTFVGNSLGGTANTEFVAEIPGGSDHVDVSLITTNLVPDTEGDLAVNCSIQAVPLPAQLVGYTTTFGGTDNSLAAVNMANDDSIYWAVRVKNSWQKIGNSNPSVNVAVGGTVRVMLHVPNSEGKSVTAHSDAPYATFVSPATMGSGGRGAFVITGVQSSQGKESGLSVTLSGSSVQYNLDVNVTPS